MACAHARASTWEAMHSTSDENKTDDESGWTSRPRTPYSTPCTPRTSHAPKRNTQAFHPVVGNHRREKRVVTSSGRHLTAEERRLEALASSWETHNRSKITARRFADTYGSLETVAGFAANVVPVTTVTAMVVVPILVDKASILCGCDF